MGPHTSKRATNHYLFPSFQQNHCMIMPVLGSIVYVELPCDVVHATHHQDGYTVQRKCFQDVPRRWNHLHPHDATQIRYRNP